MTGVTKCFIFGSVLAGGSTASYCTYEYVRPRTAQEGFDGKAIGKVSKDNSYRGIFIENKESVSDLGISDLNGSSSLSDGAAKIKKGCESELKKPADNDQWEKVLKFCEFKLSTVKGLLATVDTKDFISEEEGYKISLFWLKLNNEGKNKVKSGDTEPDHERLKTWCETELAKPISQQSKYLYSGLNYFCKSQEINTVEKAIKTKVPNGTIATESDWEALFKKWKYTDGFIDLLKKQTGNENVTKDTKDSEGKDKIKSGCENGRNKKLSEDLEDNFINYIRSACIKE